MRTTQHRQHKTLKKMFQQNKWAETLSLIKPCDDPALYCIILHVINNIKGKNRSTFAPLITALIDSNYGLALRCATSGGLEQCVDMLLEHREALGIDINAAGQPSGQTALHRAAQNGHLRIVTKLLEHGAEIDARDHNKKTPLDLVNEQTHSNPELVTLLAEADYDGYVFVTPPKI